MRKGFTLAETLITLGIIGVVAAITIPNLISTHQKKTTVTKLQKAISIINQAYRLSFDDVGEPQSAFDIGSEEYFKTYWAPYIKVLTYCTSAEICGYKSNSDFKYLNGNQAQVVITAKSARTTFFTADGFLYIIFTANGSSLTESGYEPNNKVYVDINGSAKPNTYGKDIFILERLSDGKGVQPYGYNMSDDKINNNCSKYKIGDLCAEKIRRSGWQIDKSYPWK